MMIKAVVLVLALLGNDGTIKSATQVVDTQEECAAGAALFLQQDPAVLDAKKLYAACLAIPVEGKDA